MSHGESNQKGTRATRAAKILIIDDESPIREVLSASLRDEGHFVNSAADGEKGIKAMREFQPEIVLLDIWMPGTLDGIGVLTTSRAEFPDTEFIMISGHGTIETAVKATKLGAWDFIEKPLSMDRISISISNILQHQTEKQEKQALLNKLRKSIALIGEAPSMVQLKSQIIKAAGSPGWLLIKGERGSGRELVAQNIHYMSQRASRPFVELICSSIPADLIDSELFGFERGAFAGADRTQKGKIELAHGGTLFLEDIAALSLGAQEKILRLMQEKKFTRVGGGEYIEVDVRIIGATEMDLMEEIKAGRFSEALYHRINLLTLRVPSLREHIEDIPALVAHFSDQSAREAGTMRKQISDKAMELMMTYSWPGNVRELRNFIERLYILTPEDFVDIHDLRFAGLADEGSKPSGFPGSDLSTFREARAEFERQYILKKINENNGNISKTAEVIGLERSYLHRKIKTFGISDDSTES
jgi:two-component system nitrogen regulation response regulator NtrX